ncbi:MAG: 3-deoxy-manno-octulosonate cytidylyltransferase [Phycisphaerales bacterium]|nr:MAG: 3-deoxy-manno-octulosonate cytidylyltransferase [Phycisphaerales bacterium]
MGDAIAIIPARLASTRFPEKVLACETGKPLIEHVCEAASRAERVSRVVVAADDGRIVEALRPFGRECVLTDPAHPNGTSRIDEAAERLGLSNDQIIVNAQGDEPELDPALIDAAIETLLRPIAGREPDAATIASPFREGEDPADPNIVKAVLRPDGSALYFSRALVPHTREGGTRVAPLRHVGLYVYRRGFLRRYTRMAATPLEQAEQLEQLRIIEHGGTIGVAVRESHGVGIDTPAQYEAFVRRWKASHNPS